MLLVILLLAVACGTPLAAQATLETVRLQGELPSLGRLGGVTTDVRGNVYVSNFSASVWRVSPDGAVERLSQDFQGSSGNVAAPDGSLYQASFVDNRVVRIAPDGSAETFADTDLDGPVGLALGADGTLYVCNCRSNSVTAVAPDGSSRVLASGSPLACPNGITMGPDNAPYVVSFNNGALVRIGEDGAMAVVGDSGPQGNAHVAYAQGAFWITRIATNELVRMDADGSIEGVIGPSEPTVRDGVAASGALSRPNGIAVSPDGRYLYMNNLVGPWRGEEETRIVLRRFGPLPGADASPRDEIEHVRIRVDSLVFDALAAGPRDGELVLLLHGFPQTSYAFRHQVRALAAAGYRAVAPDQRGYSAGARPADYRQYGMGYLVGDVLGIADALGADRFHLVGHDWGGAVAWVVATRHPGRVRTLTVLSTPHFAALGAQRADTASDQAQRSSYFSTFGAEGAERAFLEDHAARLRAIYGDLDAAAVDEYVRVLGEPDALRAALAWYRAAFGSPPPASAQPSQPAPPPTPVRVPTLYVWGTEDGAFGREAAEATAGHVAARYRFVPLEGLGHWLTDTAPERISALILDQVRGDDPATLRDYSLARTSLEAASTLLGGQRTQLEFAGMRASYSGWSAARGQSAAPGPPHTRVPVSGRFAFERGGRTLLEQQLVNEGGTDRSFCQVLDGDSGWNLWIARDLLSRLPGSEVTRLRGMWNGFPRP